MKNLSVNIYRDCDTWRLRKVVIEVGIGPTLVDRSRMFAGPGFKRRLTRRVARAMLRAQMMGAASMDPLP